MVRLAGIFAVFLLGMLATAPSFAATNDNAKILIHLLTPVEKNGCDRSGARPSCSQIVTAGALYPPAYFAYVLVADGSSNGGVSGAQFGIDYLSAAGSGVDIYSWTLCADAEFPMPGWPASGTGTLAVWSEANCQLDEPGGVGTGVVAVLGYFYTGAYSPDELRVTPRPVDGIAKVADCSGAESVLGGGVLGALGYAAFSASGDQGYNPCGQNTALPTCSITGPGQVASGSNAVYRVTADLPGPSYVWSITGNGAISGSATGSAVTVTAGAAGGFVLEVVVTASGRSGTCQTSVTVLPPPACIISGPSPVAPNEEFVYAVAIADPAPLSLEWTVSGSAAIIAQDGSSVRVRTFAGSSFGLTMTVTESNGQVRSCSKSVGIFSGPAPAIIGPGTVVSGAIVDYTVVGFSPVHFYWEITGNGQIVGNSGMTVRVLAGASGHFVLKFVSGSNELIHVVLIENYTPQPSQNSNAKILVHLVAPPSPDECADTRATPACADVVSAGRLGPQRYYAFVIVADCFTDGTLNSGLGGVAFGIDYDNGFHAGVDVLSWRSCGDLEFPTGGWPFSGSGNTVSWNISNNCQITEPGGIGTGVVAPVGYFYLEAHSTDELRVQPHPSRGNAAIADCRAVETILEFAGQLPNPSPLGYATFSEGGTQPGFAPCGQQPIPVIKTTWGAIKSLFEGD